MARKDSEFAEGYQEALVDISRAIREGGVNAAAEWISANAWSDTRHRIEVEIVEARTDGRS